MIRVAIAEDHAIVLAGVCRLLAMNHDVKVVSAVRSGDLLLESIKDKELDLIITDISMPGLSGIDLVARLRELRPPVPIMVLTMHKESEVADRVLKAGATGYLTKDRDPEILLSAIRQCASGGRYIDQEIAADIIFTNHNSSGESSRPQLSQREQQIFDRLVKGEPIVRIADDLGISPKTVSTHKYRLMDKLGIETLSDLVRYAIKTNGTIEF